MDEDTERRLVEHIRRAGPAYAGFPWDDAPEPLQLDPYDPRWAVEDTSDMAPPVGPPFSPSAAPERDVPRRPAGDPDPEQA